MKSRLLLFLIGLFCMAISSCNKDFKEGTVRYEVTCDSGGFDVTYQNSTGNTEQQEIYDNEWEKSFEAKQGDYVYLSAQADDFDATITVEIYYRGQVIEEATSSGDFVIATASGELP